LEANSKKIEIYFEIEENASILGDKLFLELIVNNLVSNAIKYGQENGAIHIVWDSTLKTLSVTDDGIGISPKHLPNIFDRYYRTEESRSTSIKGNGLGLSIVKKLADLQKITLSVQSTLGEGSSFTLQF
jgi:two-component system heavy metal sensor histidine kinase CusS